jgi:hypothetical protein
MADQSIKPKVECLIYRNDELTRSGIVTGRVAWALLSLIAAGAKGCTPITRPAPRWSDYVFRLRKQGFNVETKDEAHGGPYAGTYAIYILHDRVEVFGGEGFLDFHRPVQNEVCIQESRVRAPAVQPTETGK